MQLTPATAHAHNVQNRYDVSESLSGGAQYLADLLREFNGEMRLAVAAYYCGSRHLERKGLSYSNPDVVAYVESVRRRYQRELTSDGLGSSFSKGGK
jgi:soluble lytic murein transglycosylase-like protein